MSIARRLGFAFVRGNVSWRLVFFFFFFFNEPFFFFFLTKIFIFFFFFFFFFCVFFFFFFFFSLHRCIYGCVDGGNLLLKLWRCEGAARCNVFYR